MGFPFGAVGVVAIGVLGLGLAILGWGGLVFRIAFAQKVEEVTADVAVLSLGGALAMDSGEAIEEELRDIGKGQGVAAGDALVGELYNEIAEEEVNGVGIREVPDVVEEFVGGSFMLEATRLHLLANVVGAEGGVGIRAKHTAAMTFAVDVLARRQSQGLGLGLGDDRGREGDPTPGGFCVVI